MPDYQLEAKIKGVVAGIDEVGRGPWAGPVLVAAAIIDITRLSDALKRELNDSKKLSVKKRDQLFDLICADPAVEVALGEASVAEIDQMNILQATFLAMRRALKNLSKRPDFALIDGNKVPPNFPVSADCVVKGDSKSLSIAAASIVAKVTRDRLMAHLAQEFPAYGWETNAGYGTKAHQEGLAKVGICIHHRRSFAPIAQMSLFGSGE